MGFVRKVTGVQGQIDAANKNADAQVAATQQAAQSQQAALMASAKAAADQQAQIAARSAAEQKAQTAASTPLANADVQLDPEQQDTAAGKRNKKLASFGRSYNTGVNV